MKLEPLLAVQYNVPMQGAVRPRLQVRPLRLYQVDRAPRGRAREPGDDDWTGLKWKLSIGMVVVGTALITGALRLVNHDTSRERSVESLSMPLRLVAPLLQVPPADPTTQTALTASPAPTESAPAQRAAVVLVEDPAPAPSPAPALSALSAPAAVIARVSLTPPVQQVTTAAAPLAQPAPRQVPPTLAAAAQAEASEAVRAWAEAWSRRDMRGYYAAYTPDFHGRAADRDSWERERHARIALRRQIRVTTTDLRVEGSADTVRVSFMQRYESDARSETTPKLLTMKRSSHGKWLISDEQSVPALGASQKSAEQGASYNPPGKPAA